jgi:hypothetical protein
VEANDPIRARQALACGSVVLFWFPYFFRLLYDDRFYPEILLLNTAGEVARAVIEQHNEAKRENDEQSEPKKPAQKRHAKNISRYKLWSNRGWRDARATRLFADFARSPAICGQRDR